MANEPLTSTTVLQVDLADRSYPIHIGSGILAEGSEFIRQIFAKTSHAIVMFDQNVADFANRLSEPLSTAGWRTSMMSIPSGETSKSASQAESLWKAMLAEHTDRGSVVIAVGGGVTGDLAGFLAATFARGIPLIQVPTTLLSQVDSSVGGKTGINLPGAKNIVGAFWQPSGVLIDTDTLQTLPQREYVSGLAEVAKYGVILLPDLFEYLESNAESILAKDRLALNHIIHESCRAKALVVQEDERETSGRRAILNYGHTFAHALESVTGYGTLLHGEAVAIGMHMAAIAAERLGRVDEAFVLRQETLLKKLNLPTRNPGADPKELWMAMQHDKKVTHGQLRFILPASMGQVDLVDNVDESIATGAIKAAS